MKSNDRMTVLRAVVSGLEAMHGHGMAHLDIKQENTMLEAWSFEDVDDPVLELDVEDVKLGDFGFSLHLGASETAPADW